MEEPDSNATIIKVVQSTIEAGYVSCDELAEDVAQLDNLRKDTDSPSSLSSNDAGYNSSIDDYESKKEKQNFSHSQFKELRAEDVIKLFKETELSENIVIILRGAYIGLPAHCEVPTRPEWLDMEKFKAGQQFALDYYFGVNYSQMISLFIMFSFPGGLEPLIYTDKSSTPYTAYKRYLSTASRVRSWFETDVWSENSEGYKNIKRVRAMHLNVSKKLNSSSKAEVENLISIEKSARHSSLWCPLNETFGQIFTTKCPFSPIAKQLKEEKRLVFSQTEMSLTQFAFFGLIIMYPEKFGASSATKESLESFVHFWRGIGYLLGIGDEFNFCQGSFEEVKQRCQDMVDILIKPNFKNVSKEWEHMSRCMVEGVKFYIRILDFETSLAYLFWVLGIETLELRLTWRQYFRFNHLKFFMRYTLSLPGVMSALNSRLVAIMKTENDASPERHKDLKNRRFSYQKDIEN
uniref:ER-bound oxygenase mpaB/mpaB'/Rubber oxygenase catalytic domain-containing protein n=1 Tax=Clastoptera arizonana TaxID=38151 RepID=A0A1B6DAA0_9HEMI